MAFLKGQVVVGNSSLSGSHFITGSLEIFNDGSDDSFIIKSGSYESFKINSDGVMQLHVYEDSHTPPAKLGGIFFHSSSMFIGLSE